MIATLDQATLIGARDRALLLLGFAGALRRSELVALDIADIVETPDGLKLRIRRSKPIRRPPDARSASPTALTARPAPCAPGRTGWPRRGSPRGRRGGRSTGTDISQRRGCRKGRSPDREAQR
jgi:integrase